MIQSLTHRCRSHAQSSFTSRFLSQNQCVCIRMSYFTVFHEWSQYSPHQHTHTHSHTDESKQAQTHTHLIWQQPHGLWSRHRRTSCVTSGWERTGAPAPDKNNTDGHTFTHKPSAPQINTHSSTCWPDTVMTAHLHTIHAQSSTLLSVFLQCATCKQCTIWEFFYMHAISGWLIIWDKFGAV